MTSNIYLDHYNKVNADNLQFWYYPKGRSAGMSEGQTKPGLFWPVTFPGLLGMARHLKKIGLADRREQIAQTLRELSYHRDQQKFASKKIGTMDRVQPDMMHFSDKFELVRVVEGLQPVTEDQLRFLAKNHTRFDLTRLDTSSIANMSMLFFFQEDFDQPIGNWNVSNVTDMSGMFYFAKSFNQPIGNWDTSKVTDMRDMFCNAEKFNQPIGNWDTSGVFSFFEMFKDAKSFNQDLFRWDLSGDTSNKALMFNGAPLDLWRDKKLPACFFDYEDHKYFFQYLPSSTVPVATVAGKDHPGRMKLWPANFRGLLQMARYLKKIGLPERKKQIGLALVMLYVRRQEDEQVPHA